jgi:hypothetical protein
MFRSDDNIGEKINKDNFVEKVIRKSAQLKKTKYNRLFLTSQCGTKFYFFQT